MKSPYAVQQRLCAPGFVYLKNSLKIGGALPIAVVALIMLLAVEQAIAQTGGAANPTTTSNIGRLTGIVKDPKQAVIPGAQVTVTNQQTNAKQVAVTNGQGEYLFRSLPAGKYVVAVNAQGFKAASNGTVAVQTGQTSTLNFQLSMGQVSQTVSVTEGAPENAYRVENVQPGGPLGTAPILNLPYAIYVGSRQLIEDTQSRNFKELARYLPLIQFQEMQGPEVLRPEARGMQGSNMQNDRKDGMGIAVTTPSAMEEYEQVEVVTGLGGPLYGPANPSGMFNFVTKRPTDTPLRQVELEYETKSVGTIHLDLGGRVGPHNKMFGYRTNLLLADGEGYVDSSQLRRQLAAIALDVRPTSSTVIEGNFSYYNVFQHGYPGWFAYAPSTNPANSVLPPLQAPDPTRVGYGQPFLGVDLTSQISEGRFKQKLGSDWQLVLGVLNQVSDRNITTAVNTFINILHPANHFGPGNYQTFPEISFQPTLAPRFHVSSDLGYATGHVRTGRIHHEIVIGSTGYRFATYNPVVGPATVPVCPAGISAAACLTFTTNVSNPVLAVNDVNLAFPKGIYINNIIHQQGIQLGDTITLTPHWLLRVAGSYDWTWVDVYSDNAKTNFVRVKSPTGGSESQGVSPTASIMYKPRPDMTIYATFASSIQAPDVASASSATTIIVNANQVIAPYRSNEGEIGYKYSTRRISFYSDIFRVERPFANNVPGIVSPVCGPLSGTFNCQVFQITGNQLNYGAEAMLSGRIFRPLMITSGLLVLDPKLNDTGNPATNGRVFVGMPHYKSNILAEYTLPFLSRRTKFNFNWTYVGKRPLDDINHFYVPQYNTFDVGMGYSTPIRDRVLSFLIWAHNISGTDYYSTIGPGSITGSSNGTYLAHLGEPRLITASMRFNF